MKWDILLGLVGGFVGSGIFWVLEISPDAGIVAVVIVVFVGSATLIIGQRKIWPILA